ncbi:hypothetical protein LWT83_22225 [Enterobacter hormaechei]|uniref:Photorhabdus luminescens subsp. laumondii TTO1 complete genome segment 13/17 n=2 Tax=Photorhabdus laumondii subsp. laumondii TaxID=141679 RepID=Q7N0T4_PHOLL|nr:MULTISPECIES: hypothetical protein [Enterobacterales]MCE1658351.1 hypothetical protein [Enterobacter hormaechei]AWK43410.1 hypothetical protein A4R40_18880 [Photorhabdus laumondii subsp. laumondii]AXG44086.1 hypothetical protein PluDJC_18755 [Photorhabdus laumondii subsp. laumondii]AXG48718.1 hypothetical protein PluTT01m_19465 [Photorhabdus laumondii subsp. laumondii]KTL60232.1 hypothetical protein AA106_14110 [Photorhabdus laumondii subsp. laumondii]
MSEMNEMKVKIEKLESMLDASVRTVITAVKNDLSSSLKVTVGPLPQTPELIPSASEQSRYTIIPPVGPTTYQDKVLKFTTVVQSQALLKKIWVFQDSRDPLLTIKYWVGEQFNYDDANPVRVSAEGGGNKFMIINEDSDGIAGIAVTMY